MKKLMMMVVAAMLLTSTLQAQDKGAARQERTPEEKARMMTQRMDKQLDLTDAQEAKIMEINLGFARKKAELKQYPGDDKKRMHEQMKSIRADVDRQIKAVLTPEQWARKQQSEAEKKQKHGQHKEHNGQRGQIKQK